jgi:RNA polymerase sigma factor (TIGR02999 family)
MCGISSLLYGGFCEPVPDRQRFTGFPAPERDPGRLPGRLSRREPTAHGGAAHPEPSESGLDAAISREDAAPAWFLQSGRWQCTRVPCMAETDQITSVLQAIEHNESGAAEQLLPLVYGELRQLAAARMARESSAQTLQPTALVHEAWLRLVADRDRTWQNRAHFFGAAAEAMRRILIENARRRSRLKHGGDQARMNIEDLELADTPTDDRVLLINEALEHLETQEPELARIVMLRFFGGLTNQQIAETLQVSERTVDNRWTYAKARLFRYIRSQQ